MTYVVRDCTVNPPRILIEITEIEERPFDPHPQVTMPGSHRGIRPGYWVAAAILSAIAWVGIMNAIIG